MFFLFKNSYSQDSLPYIVFLNEVDITVNDTSLKVDDFIEIIKNDTTFINRLNILGITLMIFLLTYLYIIKRIIYWHSQRKKEIIFQMVKTHTSIMIQK